MSAKSAAVGLGLAAAVAIGCAAYNETNRRQGEQLISTLQARIDELHAQCEAESKRGQEEYAKGTDVFRDEHPWLQAQLVCEANTLSKEYSPALRIGVSRFDAALEDINRVLAPGTDNAKGREDVQAALGHTWTELQRVQQAEPVLWPYALSAVVILITVVLPWSWYFFLRRIRELSDAIRGH